ncbi:hypothetical protein PINS_up012499 [Pythium insidiosum]|nr:hypothetical protein PINS_up012499 [Pythium insidiosum]
MKAVAMVTKAMMAMAALLLLDSTSDALTTERHDLHSVEDVQVWQSFVEYAIEYAKEYRSLENNHALVERRFKAFKLNVDRIKAHNDKFDKGEYSFALGLNALADLSDAEYRQMLGYKRRSSHGKKAVRRSLLRRTSRTSPPSGTGVSTTR